MRRVISIIMVCILVFAMCSVNVFADSTQTGSAPNRFEDPLDLVRLDPHRGPNIPSTTVPLYNGVYSNGEGSFYYAVYSNHKYSNHGGSIKIFYTNTSEAPWQTHTMYIRLYTGDSFFTQMLVDYITCDVNDYGNHTFTGLDPNKTYYFEFYQGNYDYETTTVFTVTRGN